MKNPPTNPEALCLFRRACALPLAMSLALVLLCLPRFNRRDWLIERWTSEGQVSRELPADAGEYVKLVQFFRGELQGRQLVSPFAFRVAGPWLASFLPLPPMTALNVLNVTSLLASLWLLHGLLGWLQCSRRQQAAGEALFVFSFPVFYYGAIGIVDPMLLPVLLAGLWLILARRWWLVVMLMMLGALVRETVVVLLPVAAVMVGAFDLRNGLRRSWRPWGMLVILTLALVWMLWLVRAVSPAEPYAWTLSLRRLAFNVGRPRTWISAGLSLGVPGGFALIRVTMQLRKTLAARLSDDFAGVGGGWVPRHMYAALVVGAGTCVALFGYSLMTAYADGRFLWMGYPFFIPLAVIGRRAESLGRRA